MPAFQALDLSKSQITRFKKAYSNRDVGTAVLSNLLNSDPPPVRGLELLPVPELYPIHFNFTGNRPYIMQVVGNGEVFGIMSEQRLTKKERAGICYNIARLEIITAADLPFLKVAAPPTVQQVRAAYASFLDWTVAGYRKMEPLFNTAGGEGFGLSLMMPLRHTSEAAAMNDRILSGTSAHEVFADWLNSPSPSRPRLR